MRTTKHTKREPIDPYDCWCMNCKDCIYYLADEEMCQHPDAPPCNEVFNEARTPTGGA